MPHIDISMFPGRDEQTKQELALRIRTFLMEELKVNEKAVTVSIQDIEKEDWAEHLKSYSEETLYIKPQY